MEPTLQSSWRDVPSARWMNVGRAITETSYAGLNAKADALIQTLIDKVQQNG